MHDERIGPNPGELCQCGCGELAPLASKSDKTRERVKGQPLRYCHGHGGRDDKRVKYVEEDRGYETPCWIWQLATSKNGYGLSNTNGSRLAHRNLWEQRNGPVPEGKVLDHLCRVHPCVNPDHLEPVTHPENCRRGTGTKLTTEQVAEVRVLLRQGWRQRDIASA